MNRAQRRKLQKSNKTKPISDGSLDSRKVMASLNGICQLRDENWSVFRGHEATFQRIIENSPQTEEEIGFVMKVMVAAMTEVVVRQQIEDEVTKIMEAREEKNEGN